MRINFLEVPFEEIGLLIVNCGLEQERADYNLEVAPYQHCDGFCRQHLKSWEKQLLLAIS